ncbi:MAG: F0F1 ATP synthase subunit gamma [Bowdeniella nasicola]|nr:F0F1 ATP synthase subunit gamma [Bowdeniella nasicola]
MSGAQRIYKNRIKSTQTLKKVFRAMELIAASRIGKARDRAVGATPYAEALTQAVSAVANHTHTDHPLTKERHDTPRVAVLVIAADRGMAGAYTANVLRATERLLEDLDAEGKIVDLFVAGRRGIGYFTFQDRELAGTWSGESDSPSTELASEIADTLLERFLAARRDGGVSELHVVFTRFKTMVTQTVEVRRMLPLAIVEGVSEVQESDALPLYEFEPSAEEVLDALLPLYVRSRIHNALLHAAASELASRQRAMHTATDNAEDLIRNYTRLANSARQAEITQEISEIVSGADALASS